MANSTGQPYVSGSSGNLTFNIPVSGGNASINLSTGAVTLSTGSASASGNVTAGTEKLTAGPVSLSIASNGNDSVTINTGIVSTTLNFQPTEESTTEITGATVSGTYFGLNASISIQESGNSWIGSASYGIKAPGDNPISNWINNYTIKEVSFDPQKDNPCTLLGTGMAASACNVLESGSKNISINTNEQQQAQENGIISDAVDPTTASGDATLAAEDGPGITFDETYPYFAGGTPPPGTTGIGTGTGGTGGTVAAVARGGYAAALAAQSGRRNSGTDIASIGGSGPRISPLTATGNTSVLAADLAKQIGIITGGSNQLYWELGNADGLLLNGTGGAIGGISDDLAANIYVPNSTNTGASYSTYNKSGALTAIAFDGTGESSSINSGTVTVADSSSASVSGNSNTINLGNSSTVSVSGTSNTLHLGSADTVSGSSLVLTLAAAGQTLTVSGNSNQVQGPASASLVGNADTIYLTGNLNSVSATNSNIYLSGTGQTVSVGSQTTTGGNTVYANNSTIIFYGYAQSFATDKVVGTGNHVNYRPTITGGLAAGRLDLSAAALVQAMAGYAPESAADMDLTVRPEFLERPSLAASSYLSH